MTSIAPTNSQGPGNGGGAGSGSGTGNGEGSGPGIGPGSGGGTGGGPYRPGSGIVAPELLKEVRPDYTEEARRRGLAVMLSSKSWCAATAQWDWFESSRASEQGSISERPTRYVSGASRRRVVSARL